MSHISTDRHKRFAQTMRHLIAEAYERRPSGAHGRAVKWSMSGLADDLGYAEGTVEAFLKGRRVPPPESLPCLFKFLRKRKAVTDFDRAWEWVRTLGSARHLKAVREAFEPPPFVQTAPQPPASAVERAEAEVTWQRLIEGTGPVVVWGMPGIGKTTLGQQIAHRDDVPLFFPDGVLWVELGPEWKTGDWIECWAAVLGMPAQDAQQRAEIVQRVSAGRYLLIVDNVWSGEAVQALRRHNPYARLLVLCANQAVAQEIGGEPLALREMDEEEAIALVQRLIRPEKFDRDQARHLARTVGLHPLAISIAAFLANESGLEATLREIADEQMGLDTLTIGPEGTEPSALPRSVRAAFNVAYRHLGPAAQEHLRLLTILPDRLPYVDRALMGVLMKQRDTVAAHNALRRLAEFGIVEPVEAKSLADKWGVWQLKPQAESNPLYRINPLWLRFAREKAAEAGPSPIAVMWRIAWSPAGARQGPFLRPVFKSPPGKKVGWELGELFRINRVKRMVQETEQAIHLHGLMLDPHLRPILNRILYRLLLLEGQLAPAFFIMAGLLMWALMFAGLGLSLVLQKLHAPWWLSLVSGILLLLLGAATFPGLASSQIITKFEAIRLLWWLYKVLLPLSLMEPDARAERLKELGITGDVWSAMVRM